MITYIKGDLIELAKAGSFDVIAHGCNCFCRMNRGIAPQMAKAFGSDRLPLESKIYKGDVDKLGRIQYKPINVKGPSGSFLIVVNAYTQYQWDTNTKPFDYDAFVLCMRKMNYVFKGTHIGLPKIGSHLAGGDWNRIEAIIERELKDCKVTVVEYDPNA